MIPLLDALSAPHVGGKTGAGDDDDVLPKLLLKQKAPKTASKNYFVLTSNEAYRDKLEARKRKEEKERKMKIKK